MLCIKCKQVHIIYYAQARGNRVGFGRMYDHMLSEGVLETAENQHKSSDPFKRGFSPT